MLLLKALCCVGALVVGLSTHDEMVVAIASGGKPVTLGRDLSLGSLGGPAKATRTSSLAGLRCHFRLAVKVNLLSLAGYF